MRRNITRRKFCARAGIAAGGAAASMAGLSFLQCGKKRRPNIIFIMADDMGYGDVGCYGQTKIQTPRLDQLAAEGIRCTDFYAGASVCTPSRRCFITGTHAGHYVDRHQPNFPIKHIEHSIGKLAQQAGYATGCIGKWAIGNAGTPMAPNAQGFDYFFGYIHPRNAHEYYPEYLWRNDEQIQLNGEKYSHDLFTEEAISFITQHREHPFFLYLPYTIPHQQFEVPTDAPYADKPWPQVEKNFAAMITRMDRDIGRMTDLLDELNIGDDTILFFTSDNGAVFDWRGHELSFFNSAGPFRGTKSELYEGGIRVPMIIRWKNHIQPRQTINEPWALWDMLPTVSELAGCQPPEDVDGLSMVPALVNGNTVQHDYLYWEIPKRGFFTQAVRFRRWKGVRIDLDEPIELYDLEKDPAETINVAGNNPEVVKRIQYYFDDLYKIES